MQITLVALSFEDEVVPVLELASTLQSRGHTVRVLTSAEHADLVSAYGLQHLALSDSVRPGPTLTLVEQGRVTIGEAMRRYFDHHARAWARQGLEACEGVDCVLGGGLASYAAASFAEATGAQFIEVLLCPRLLLSPPADVQRHTKLTWDVQRRALNVQLRPALGLRPYPESGPHDVLRQRQTPVLCAFSPQFAPHADAFPPHVSVTGFWHSGAERAPQAPPSLEEFCSGPERPLYVGFGKGNTQRELDKLSLALDTVRLASRRAVVIASTWAQQQLASKLQDDRLLVLEHAPHAWLFPRVSAAIHQGGAAVIGATLAAGTPELLLADTADEQCWAFCLTRAQVAARSLEQRDLTPASLCHALNAIESEETRRNCAAWADRLKIEIGCTAGAHAIESWLDRRRSSSTPQLAER